MGENCRFCLKNLDFSDKFHEINDDIKFDFLNVTQHELHTSSYINIVCELCLRSLQLASSLKKQLIENQEKFYKDYDYAAKYDDQFEEPAVAQKVIKNDENDSISEQSILEENKQIKREKPLNIVVYEISEIAENSPTTSSRNKILGKHKLAYNDGKFECPICSKGFKKIEHLKAHMVHHDEPKFSCDICGRKYFDKTSVGHHMRSNHLKSRDFRCTYCPKSYFKKGTLKRHILSMHKKQKYTCGIESCFKSFNYKHHCKNHIMSIHRFVRKEDIESLILFNITNPSIKEENNLGDLRIQSI